jgi:hypothetical protein
MSIYLNDDIYDIYGIKIYYITHYNIRTLFEIKMDTIMSDEKKKEVRLFYNELREKDTMKLRFKIYTEVSSTNNEVMSEEITLDSFLQHFS